MSLRPADRYASPQGLADDSPRLTVGVERRCVALLEDSQVTDLDQSVGDGRAARSRRRTLHAQSCVQCLIGFVEASEVNFGRP